MALPAIGWARTLRERLGGKKLAVSLEQSRGGLIYALMKYEFLVLYPIKPITVAKYRKAWSPSGTKNDPGDADLLLDLLERHRDKFQPWEPDTIETRALQRLVESRNKLVQDRKRLGNRLTSLLKDYFPQVLSLFAHVGRRATAEFLLK